MATVTVILPTYNSGEFLPGTLDSVLGQTYPDLVVQVVDDGSTDGTGDWMRAQTDERIRYHYQQNSGSPTGSRNTGLRLAETPLIAFIDADDLWLPDKLEKQVAALADPAVGLCYTGASYIDEHGTPLAKEPALPDYSGDVLEQLLVDNFVTCSSVVVRRDLLTADGLCFRDDRVATEDWDLWLRLAMRTRFAALAEPLVKYRLHGGNLSGNPLNMGHSVVRTVTDIGDELEARFAGDARLDQLRRAWQAGATGNLLLQGHRCREQGDKTGARELFLEAIGRHPGNPRGWWGFLKSCI